MKVEIDYDASRSRFHLTAPFQLSHIPRGLANRRWDSKRKVWSAPAIRANILYLDTLQEPTVGFTPAAREAMKESKHRIEELAAKRRGVNDRFPSGYPFKTAPRPKQLEALNKIHDLPATALFMDMRTGKTKVVIDNAAALQMAGKVERVLVVVPLSIRRNWVREIEMHSPVAADTFLLDTTKAKAFDEWNGTAHGFKWLMVGVESLAAGSAIKYAERFLLTGGGRTMCVVDESSKIKNHSANRAKNCVRLGRMAEFRIAMTGTPIANGPMDLFMQFEFLDPDIIGMGDFYSFRNRYAIMGGYEGRQIVGYDNLDELMEIVEPFVFQVRKGEVFPDAPAKIYQRRDVQMTPAQRSIYDRIKKDKAVMIDDSPALVVQNTLELMLRLQQVCGGFIPVGPDDDGKYDMIPIEGANAKVAEMVDAVQENPGRTVIWCAFRKEIAAVVAALTEHFPEERCVMMHGDVTEEDRDRAVQDFQAGRARFFVGNAATGGMGLTLSAGQVIIYFSNTFNHIDREQSEERTFGPEKKEGTVVVDLVCDGTVDSTIVDALSEKKSVSEYVRHHIQTLKSSPIS